MPMTMIAMPANWVKKGPRASSQCRSMKRNESGGMNMAIAQRQPCSEARWNIQSPPHTYTNIPRKKNPPAMVRVCPGTVAEVEPPGPRGGGPRCLPGLEEEHGGLLLGFERVFQLALGVELRLDSEHREPHEVRELGGLVDAHPQLEDARLHLTQRGPAERERLDLVGPVEPGLVEGAHQGGLTHVAPVTTVVFDAGGRRVLTASLDGTACLWDVDRSEALQTLRHPAPVQHAFLSPDGRSIVTQCADGRARCWDADSGRERFPSWPLYVAPMALPLSGTEQFSPDGTGFVSVLEDRAEIRSLSTGQLTHPPLVQPGPLVHAAFSRDGGRLVTTTAEGLVCAWALEADGGFRPLGRQQHSGGGNLAEFSPEGDRVLSLGVEPEARLWDAVSGRLLADPLSHFTQVRMGQARFSPDGSRIFTASNDNSVRIWNGTNGALLIRGIGHSRQINAARWDPAGRRIATASFDGTVSLWDVATGRPLGPVLRQDGYAVDVAFSPSGDRLVTVSQGGGVRLWTLRPRPVGVLRGPEDLISSASFNADATRVGIAPGGQDFEVRESVSGELLHRLHHPTPAYLGEFDPAGRLLVTAAKGGRMHVWDLADGREAQVSEPDGLERWWIKFDPKGGRFLSSDERRGQNSTFSATLWSVADLRATRLSLPLANEARNPDFSPDGGRLLIEAGKGRLLLWNLAAGQMEGLPLVDEGRPFARGRFSPGGEWLIAYQADRSLIPNPARLWDARTLRQVGPLLLAPDSFLESEFTADGRRVATGGQDSTARIWSVPEGQPLVPVMPHESMVLGVRFSRDGRVLATSTRLGAVRLWDARTGEPLSASHTVTGGVVAMAFVRGDGPLVVVGGDAALHRWDLTPATQSEAELDALARELDGEVRGGAQLAPGQRPDSSSSAIAQPSRRPTSM